MLIPILTILSMIFFWTNHPLIMIFTLTSFTMFLSILIISTLTLSWFSYILILILLGAMLIIFLYMVSLAPNEIFTKTSKFKLMFVSVFPTILVFQTTIKSSFLYTNSLFSPSPSTLTIMTATFLLITMIAIVKISSISLGPMKSN